MAVVRKAQSSPNTIKKKAERKASVDIIRQASNLSELSDTNFGVLDSSKDGLIVSYDSNSNKFVLTTSDQILQVSAEDNDIPDDFVTTLEGELNLGQIQLDNLDGGFF